MEDKTIVSLFLSRSPDAVTALDRKYGSRMKETAFAVTGDARDAEECVSDALLAVWNTIPPERPDPLSAYVFRILRNVAIKKFHANTAQKRNSFYDAALDELSDCVPARETVEDAVAERELTASLNRFLAKQTKENRFLFVRRYFYADPTAQIAKSAGLSEHTVTVRLSRLRAKLKETLEQEGVSV